MSTPAEIDYQIGKVRRTLELLATDVVLGRNSPGVGPVEQITFADLASALTVAGGLGTGTVTSVALTAPSILTVTGSPITSAGTFALALAVQPANTVLAGPTSGASATPTMRALVAADLPAGVWTSSNDGAGSGLDADLLDAQQGSHYLARANHTGTQAWSTITGTPTTLSGYGITDAASDAELAAHAALTTGAHGMTAFGASLVDDASASAARTTLGLGTAATVNVPAAGNASTSEAVKGDDTRLTDARTPTAHTHPSTAISDSTTAGRALLTGADASAQRTSLGLGGAAVLNVGTSAGTVASGDAPGSAVATHAALTTGVHGITSFGATLAGASDATAARGFLLLGTASTRDVPSSGDASAMQAVIGNDTRLTNARTPTAHTHPASEISDSTGAGRALLTATDDIEQLDLLGLIGSGVSTIDSPAKYAVRVNSSGTVSTRHRLNLIAGSGVTLSLSDDGVNDEADVTVSASGGSGNVLPITTKTSSYTATTGDCIIVCTASSAMTITLPTSASAGQIFYVRRTAGSSDNVTIEKTGGTTLATLNSVGTAGYFFDGTDFHALTFTGS